MTEKVRKGEDAKFIENKQSQVKCRIEDRTNISKNSDCSDYNSKKKVYCSI